ncbi:MAG: hypothetical protein HY673_14810 [Chloroflexi bacterium]|nr:hypothetical protein [Chloroflexota bacterium]
MTPVIGTGWFWIFGAAMGTIFGILAAALWAESMCCTAVAERKKVAPWLLSWVGIDPNAKSEGESLLSPRYAEIVKKGLSGTAITASIAGFHKLFWAERPWTLENVIVAETSFPLFAALAWLLPVFFLKRYLSRLG